MKTKLKNLLFYLKEGKGIALGEDTFLIGACDGSDKIYGFVKTNGALKVITRQTNEGYPIGDMDKIDLDYLFKLSKVGGKIKKRKYKIVGAGEV